MSTYSAVLKPSGVRDSYLNITSTMDTKWESSTHNPADIQLALPNSTRTNKIWKIVPQTVSIPRMFPNIYAPDNELIWYQREVVELPTDDPTIWVRTVAQDWTITRRLTFPPGLWNVDQVLVHINAVTGPDEVWTFDTTLLSFKVTVTPSAPAVVFGEFVVIPPHITPAVTYANMTYIAEPGTVEGKSVDSHMFDILGLERVASVLSTLPLSPNLIQLDPNTFDNLNGTNLGGRNVYPLFDRTLANYALWAVTPYTSPDNNQPNLAGPTVVHVLITDLGDSSTVDAQTGLLQDIVISVGMGDVPFGTFKERLLGDVRGEGIEFQQARNISNFKVRLLDTRNRQLFLPRNFPVFLRLQLTHTLD